MIADLQNELKALRDALARSKEDLAKAKADLDKAQHVIDEAAKKAQYMQEEAAKKDAMITDLHNALKALHDTLARSKEEVSQAKGNLVKAKAENKPLHTMIEKSNGVIEDKTHTKNTDTKHHDTLKKQEKVCSKLV